MGLLRPGDVGPRVERTAAKEKAAVVEHQGRAEAVYMTWDAALVESLHCYEMIIHKMEVELRCLLMKDVLERVRSGP